MKTDSIPSFVRIAEVGPRDGLQNEKQQVATATKVELIERLTRSGVQHLEAGSFVSPKWVPQMADSLEVMQTMPRKDGVRYAALTPNKRGYDQAVEAKADEVAIFGAASEAFSQKNINCSIEESLARFQDVVDAAKAAGIPVRGYVSCILGCPYEGPVTNENAAEVFAKVKQVTQALLDMGCYEVSLGDTIGTGTPLFTQQLLDVLLADIPVEKLAVHFHDTYGQALANILVAVQNGIAVVDSSVAGLGGCPYAKGASGNVATEDVLYMLQGMGIETGIDLQQLVKTGRWISEQLGRPNGSKVGRAL
jgi:hydroxymethylglutaryl-CoA lyase